jgi:predicted HTH transcriptional regulator
MRYDLEINGVDYNRELDLLSEYINRVVIPPLPSGIIIDVGSIPIDFDPSEIIKLYKQKGVMFFNSSPIDINPIEIITFEYWKKDFQEQQSNTAW